MSDISFFAVKLSVLIIYEICTIFERLFCGVVVCTHRQQKMMRMSLSSLSLSSSEDRSSGGGGGGVWCVCVCVCV